MLNVLVFFIDGYTNLFLYYYSHPVNIADFKEHVRAMSADSDFKYAEEFEVREIILEMIYNYVLNIWIY